MPAEPHIDVLAVLASLQEQIEQLTATVEAQQRTLKSLVAQSPSH